MTVINKVNIEKFGDLVSSIREILGINQKELGNRLNRSSNTISRWELNQVVPEDPEIIVLAMKGLIYEKYASNARIIDNVFNPQNALEGAKKTAPFNYSHIWSGIVTGLNDRAKELGLDDLQIKYHADKQTALDLIKICPQSIEEGFTYAASLDPQSKGQDAFLVEQKVAAFLDGANHILEFYRFKPDYKKGYNYFEDLKRIAQDFYLINSHSTMNDSKLFNKYLLANFHMLRLFAQAVKELGNKFAPEVKLHISISEVRGVSGWEYRVTVTISNFKRTKENMKLLVKFDEGWWQKNMVEHNISLWLTYV